MSCGAIEFLPGGAVAIMDVDATFDVHLGLVAHREARPTRIWGDVTVVDEVDDLLDTTWTLNPLALLPQTWFTGGCGSESLAVRVDRDEDGELVLSPLIPGEALTAAEEAQLDAAYGPATPIPPTLSDTVLGIADVLLWPVLLVAVVLGVRRLFRGSPTEAPAS